MSKRKPLPIGSDDGSELFVWPPAIAADQEVLQTVTTENTPKSIGAVIFGLFCGFILSLFCGASVFVILMKIGGAQMLHGATPHEWITMFYVGRTVESLSLTMPILLYFWIRRRNHTFSLGLLIGGSLPNLFFFKLFFVGI